MDTIFALASARGKSGVAVIRISGPGAFAAGRAIAGDVPAPRHTGLRVLRRGDEVLDQALVLCFEAGHSFTGEDVVELQTHGSPAVVASVLDTLSGMDGLRSAEAGEFTRRALENEVLDLAQVEGLSDLIEAETEAQRRQAQKIFSGALGERAEAWRRDLLRAAALIEATIDFADEEVPVDVSPEVASLLDEVRTGMRSEIAGVAVAERLRGGFEVAIVGPPNAGKSTLLNHLAGRDAAITSEVAGTTRDVIEVHMDLSGLPVTFLDTAGLREGGDEIEAIGIARSIDRARAADLRVFLMVDDAALPLSPGLDDFVLRGKSDLGSGDVSGRTGHGVAELLKNIEGRLAERVSGVGVAIRRRHADAMARAVEHLDLATAALADDMPTEIAAEELRAAVRACDALVGRMDVEHILGEIFSRFCIGK